jgi:predicted aspartyl protease
MGFTYVKIKVKKTTDSEKAIDEKLLVDSGAIYTVIPKQDLQKLGIIAHSEEEFELANGEFITRKIGDAFLNIKGKEGLLPLSLGKKVIANF